MADRANVHQVAEVVRMIADGKIGPELTQALIEGRVVIRYEVMPTGAGVNGYYAFVEYANPAFAVLEKAFDWVYDAYRIVEFKSIDVCKDVRRRACEIEFELVHMNKKAATNTVLTELDRRGLRPALYEELLAFAQKYPELQKQYAIVALGSVCIHDSRPKSPSICLRVHGRGLGLYGLGRGWHGDCRFLAVRK